MLITFKQSHTKRNENVEEEAELHVQEDSVIEWSNLIFLPFHPAFKMIVLLSVITKSILVSVR